MKTARIVVLGIAGVAGLAAMYLASVGDRKPAPGPPPVVQLPTVEVLVAKSDIGLGQSVKPEDVQWQRWPAETASSAFLRHDTNADAMTDVIASIHHPPLL